MDSTIRIAYFGGEPIGLPILLELEKAGITPELVVCNPDRPVGRKQILTPPRVKIWAQHHEVPVWQPESFKDKDAVIEKLSDFDLFIVVAYNKILPKWLIEIPKYKTLNVHPSLLPLLRGASPIRSAILADMREEVGVSIMVLDAEMDHGPIVVQKKLDIPESAWPIAGPELDTLLAELGGNLLAASLPGYINGDLTPEEQEHEYATYCPRLERSMGKLDIDPCNLPTGEEAYQALLKIRAFEGFPGTFFMHNGKRIKIQEASLTSEGSLRIGTITPEGKTSLDFDIWLAHVS